MIDTLDIYTKLKATGLTAKQSETIAKVLFLVHTARVNEAVNAKDAQVGASFSRKEA